MPSSDAFDFLRFTDKGKVHIYARNEQSISGLEGSWASLIMQKQTAKCGAAGDPGRQYGISEFHDRELCMACYKRVPEKMRNEIFASFDNPQEEYAA